MTAIQDGASLAAVQDLLDCDEIEQLISRLAAALDERRIEQFEQIFAADVQASFPFGSVDGIEQMGAIARRNLAPYEKTQHVITNVLVQLDGDRADVRAHLIAVHVPVAAEPSTHFDVGATYRFAVRRTDDGWRLARLELTPVWTSGVPAGAPHDA